MKVASRRYEGFLKRIIRLLGPNSKHLTPRAAAAVLKFRRGLSPRPPRGAPKPVYRVVMGSVADLHIQDAFPFTKCFVK
eukprot:2368764-Prymnesium_polylepis.1